VRAAQYPHARLSLKHPRTLEVREVRRNAPRDATRPKRVCRFVGHANAVAHAVSARDHVVARLCAARAAGRAAKRTDGVATALRSFGHQAAKAVNDLCLKAHDIWFWHGYFIAVRYINTLLGFETFYLDLPY